MRYVPCPFVHAGRPRPSPALTNPPYANDASMSQSAIISEFWTTVRAHGLHDGLRFLNARTPHRYTAIYRYDGDMLRNVALYDQFAPSVCKGDDVELNDAYCSVVGQRKSGVEFADIRDDDSIPTKPNSDVVSYCGALITDDHGEPFGTLCHFDTRPSRTRLSELPILEAIAPLIYTALEGGDAPSSASARRPDRPIATPDDFGEPLPMQ